MCKLYIKGSIISKFYIIHLTVQFQISSINSLSLKPHKFLEAFRSHTRWFHSLHLPVPSLGLCWPLPPMRPQPSLRKETRRQPLRCFSSLSIKPCNLVPKISAGGAHQVTTLAVWPHQSLSQRTALPTAIATRATSTRSESGTRPKATTAKVFSSFLIFPKKSTDSCDSQNLQRCQLQQLCWRCFVCSCKLFAALHVSWRLSCRPAVMEGGLCLIIS